MLQVSQLLTSRGDIFSNKVKFLQFNFGNWSKFPKQNNLFPFGELSLFILSQWGITFYLLELVLCLVGNIIQESHMSLLYDLSFPADGLIIKISWCVTSVRFTDQQWCNAKDAVQLSEEDEGCSHGKSISHEAAQQLWWTHGCESGRKRCDLTEQTNAKYYRIKWNEGTGRPDPPLAVPRGFPTLPTALGFTSAPKGHQPLPSDATACPIILSGPGWAPWRHVVSLSPVLSLAPSPSAPDRTAGMSLALAQPLALWGAADGPQHSQQWVTAPVGGGSAGAEPTGRALLLSAMLPAML